MSNAFGTSPLAQLLPVTAPTVMFREEHMAKGVAPLFEITRIGKYMSVGLALRKAGKLNVLTTRNKMIGHLLDLSTRGQLLDLAWSNFESLRISPDGTPELRIRVIGQKEERYLRIDNGTNLISALLWRFPVKHVRDLLPKVDMGDGGIVVVPQAESIAVVSEQTAHIQLAKILQPYAVNARPASTSTPVPLRLTNSGWVEYVPPAGSKAHEYAQTIMEAQELRNKRGYVDASYRVHLR
ncbi:MAG: hypothetical protein QP744_03890 [Winkia sp. UMB750A]|uniref:hypothetical protein n=1 Tax=Winkia TaxID=2692118 RepID=UPI0023AA0442|nr:MULTISPECIES: hypothetical protein [Winkia]MDK7905961.1 hypothetical protein [Winkia sp. UMB0889B]MDK8225150.1 hypothetical protein [Winkia sp. UMB750B]MDK8256604.1 hypothetical protein [Winkia sp. UMB750A]WEB72617.1 hypothetical protein PUW51_09865 [Winkia neuii]